MCSRRPVGDGYAEAESVVDNPARGGNFKHPRVIESRLRRIETRVITGRVESVRVSLHPELADALQNDLRKELADLEREFDIRVEIIAATSLHRSEERIEWKERSKAPAAHPIETAAVTAADLADGVQSDTNRKTEPESGDAHVPSSTTDKPARKRHRGGRKRRKPAASDEKILDAEASSESPETQATHDIAEPARNEGDDGDNGGAGKEKPPRKRRRPRRRRKTSDSHDDSMAAKAGSDTDNREDTRTEADGNESDGDKEPPKKPRKRRRGGRRRRKKPTQPVETGDNGVGTDGEGDHAPQAESDPAPTKDEPAEAGADKPPKSRRRRPRRPRKPKTDAASKPEPAPEGDDPFAY